MTRERRESERVHAEQWRIFEHKPTIWVTSLEYHTGVLRLRAHCPQLEPRACVCRYGFYKCLHCTATALSACIDNWRVFVLIIMSECRRRRRSADFNFSFFICLRFSVSLAHSHSDDILCVANDTQSDERGPQWEIGSYQIQFGLSMCVRCAVIIVNNFRSNFDVLK